ncbi:hypothetical protein Cni_G28326 [Canna indica]|uniref:Uncharacterized protein n=1 Tax=Canna indica TaxID=4628 RepID=A0AAQ3QS88_9LILI|nr:hypothetical protein Cni_G28326 [Canna indica]
MNQFQIKIRCNRTVATVKEHPDKEVQGASAKEKKGKLPKDRNTLHPAQLEGQELKMCSCDSEPSSQSKQERSVVTPQSARRSLVSSLLLNLIHLKIETFSSNLEFHRKQ